MQILRTDWKGNGKFASVAKALNSIGRLINDMFGENGIEVEYRGGRLVISSDGRGGGGGSFPWNLFAFGFSLRTAGADDETYDEGATVCAIQPGAIRIHGVGIYKMDAKAEVDFAGMSAPWVYATMLRGGGPVSVGVSSSEPESNTTTLKVPLFQFNRTERGNYVLPEGGAHHVGDINFDTPLL